MLLGPRLAPLLSAGIVAPLLTVAVAAAAAAHGAPQYPVSRSVACGSAGKFTQTAACRAARAGGEGLWFDQWDNVRVAEVNGRDRQTIPDGRLCSGGLDHFGGLDLARRDWPTTHLQAGKQITVSYRATIPHQGTFRMYVTKNGYDPTRPLRWADLEAKPFLTATDPRFDGTAYKFKGTLPRGKVGHHVLYTIWQNSSTADTYYSCSDVVFTKSASTGAAVRPSTSPAPKPRAETAQPSTGAAAQPSASPAGELRTGAVADTAGFEDGNSLPKAMLAGLGLIALVGAAGGALVARRRVRRPAGY